jgi:hypothetical protein
LDGRDVSWVTRAKDNMCYEVLETLSRDKEKILKDELV